MHAGPLKLRDHGFGKLVVVQRTDLSLDDSKGQGLSVADNRVGEIGLAWDADVLKDISTDIGDLRPYFTDQELREATGQSDPEPTDADAEWVGMPEAHNVDVQVRQVVIHFKSAQDVQDFAELIGQPITDKTKYIWYPIEKPIVARKTKYVEQDSTEIPDIHTDAVQMG